MKFDKICDSPVKYNAHMSQKQNFLDFFSVFSYHSSKEKIKNFNDKICFFTFLLLKPPAMLVSEHGGHGIVPSPDCNFPKINNSVLKGTVKLKLTHTFLFLSTL